MAVLVSYQLFSLHPEVVDPIFFQHVLFLLSKAPPAASPLSYQPHLLWKAVGSFVLSGTLYITVCLLHWSWSGLWLADLCSWPEGPPNHPPHSLTSLILFSSAFNAWRGLICHQITGRINCWPRSSQSLPVHAQAWWWLCGAFLQRIAMGHVEPRGYASALSTRFTSRFLPLLFHYLAGYLEALVSLSMKGKQYLISTPWGLKTVWDNSYTAYSKDSQNFLIFCALNVSLIILAAPLSWKKCLTLLFTSIK